MVKTNRLKIGIIGLGQRGGNMTRTILACDDAEIVAVCDAYEDRVKDVCKIVAEKSGKNPEEYCDYTKLLKDKNVEAVFIASSWDTHVKIAIDSLSAGKITAMEVGGSYDVEECWELVREYERTKTPIMFMENCCYDKFELLTTALVRAGKLGEIVHCKGAYAHDLRDEVAGGFVNRHYRLLNYLKRNCDNYPTHELGPIAKILDINRGNRMVSLVSVASKAAGMEKFLRSDKNPDKSLIGSAFKQGDVVNTVITCANGETILLTLDTTLPRYYSRDFTVQGTNGLCVQDANMVFLDEKNESHEFYDASKTIEKYLNNAEEYGEYLVPQWRNITEEERNLGHGGMDYFMFKEFIRCALSGEEMPIDVYDAASWMSITALSEQSVALGGQPQAIPDFTRGAWLKRPRKDVYEFNKKD